MARGFRIHSSAVFNPFDYQQMLAPLMQAQTAYNQMQDSLLAAGEEANQYKQLIDSDEWAKGVLQGYNTALEDATNRLNSEGLRGTNRNTMLRLRKTYNDTVKPVNDAAKTLAELQNTYRQAYAKDNTLMRGAMPSIRELVENPGATPLMVSGLSLYSQGANAAKAASARKQDFKVRLNGLVRGYIDTVQRTGYNSEEAAQFLDAARRQPELQEIVNQIYGANQVGNLTNPNQGMDWIIRGVFDGLAYDQKNDLKYDQHAAEMGSAARKSRSLDSVSLLKPINIYSQRERSKSAKNIDKFQDMFTRQSDGSWKINDRGRKNLSRDDYYLPAGSSVTGARQGQIPLGSSMRKLLEDYAGKKLTTERDVETAWTQYYNENSADVYDAHRDTGYRFIPQSDDATAILNLIKGHGAKGKKNDKIAVVDFDPQTKKYKDIDTISSEDLKSVVDLDVTQYGIVVNALDKDAKEVQVSFPKISPMHYNAVISNSKQLHDFEDKWNTLLNSFNYPEGSQPPVEEVAALTAQKWGLAAGQELMESYHNYVATQQAIYNNLANTYRSVNTESLKL